MKLRRK
jgi:mannose-6-phosphate isomerase-like protein (cupin superfamily)